MKFVLSADLHLGCTSTRLPEEWKEKGRTISAWKRLVDATISEKPEMLILCGDLVDSRNQLWETLGPLKEGISRLHAAGIHCIAVSGNHDATTLPDLATQLPEEAFTLLGKNGEWQRKTVSREGQPVMHIDGWSFPSAKVAVDPARSYPFQDGTDSLPVLAMVHGDPGSPSSQYAPLSIPFLQSLPVSGWLLGHIHKSDFTAGTPWVLMPGSPHPLDPGEPGSHHAWIMELSEGRLLPPKPFCPALLRYETVELLFEADDPVSIDAISGKLKLQLAKIQQPEMCMLRIRLTGYSRDLEALTGNLENLGNWKSPGLAVESVKSEVHPALDYNEVAEAGPVFSLLVNAMENTPQELNRKIQKVIQELQHQNEFSGKNLSDNLKKNISLTAHLETVIQESLRQIS